MAYFSKFPITTYANTQVVDVLKRVRVLDSVRNQPYAYYPYTVKDGMRADTIANKYYKDQMASWLVWLSMDIIDPYHQYPLSQDAFNEYIQDKYGSWTNAQSRVAYWELNWADDGGDLSTTGYASLPDDLKKYYKPVYGIGASIMKYTRRNEDWLTQTNMIVTYGLESDVFRTAVYRSGEQVQIKTGNTVVGNAEVCWSNTSTVIVQHVFGSQPTSNATIVSLDSNTTGNVISRDYTSNCIAIDERVYWEPVTLWDHELSLNQTRKHIRLIDAAHKTTADNDLTRLMANDTPHVII